MRKTIKQHEQKNVKSDGPSEPSANPLPPYLLDRSLPTNAKALSTAIKQKRAEKAAKFSVPLPKVRGISEEEMFKVVKTGKKTAKKGWKRVITKPTFGRSPAPPHSHRDEVSGRGNALTAPQLVVTSPDAPSSTSASSGPWDCVTRRPTSPTPSSPSLSSSPS